MCLAGCPLANCRGVGSSGPRGLKLFGRAAVWTSQSLWVQGVGGLVFDGVASRYGLFRPAMAPSSMLQRHLGFGEPGLAGLASPMCVLGQRTKGQEECATRGLEARWQHVVFPCSWGFHCHYVYVRLCVAGLFPRLSSASPYFPK